MKTSQFTLPSAKYTMSCNFITGHYKLTMRLGRVFPTTKTQAISFLSFGWLDVLNATDVAIVEALLNKHGYTGSYEFTKSQNWVRLASVAEFRMALKKEFGI
jgi:hypothetical protein